MTQQEVQAQAGKILLQVAGYVGVKTIRMGIRSGLIEEISKQSDGISSADLAKQIGKDELYVDVWCKAAYGCEILELAASGGYVLAAHMDQLLLNEDFPGWIGGIPSVMSEPEMFDIFEERLESGQRSWWDQASSDFITGVAGTGRPFYTRMIPNGFSQVEGLSEKLESGASVAELACGAGTGLTKFANAYPNCTLVGIDGDEFSLGMTRDLLADAGLSDRVDVQHSTFEEWSPAEKFDMVFINISMHECRDMQKTASNVYNALNPGGYFVISDMPFPATTEELRTVPARVMSGIQFWEAQIDDQLLPTQDYVDLLGDNGFSHIEAFDMTPVHVVVHGRRP